MRADGPGQDGGVPDPDARAARRRRRYDMMVCTPLRLVSLLCASGALTLNTTHENTEYGIEYHILFAVFRTCYSTSRFRPTRASLHRAPRTRFGCRYPKKWMPDGRGVGRTRETEQMITNDSTPPPPPPPGPR